MNNIWEVFVIAVTVCGGTATIIGLFKHFLPAFKIGTRIANNKERIAKLEKHQKELYDAVRDMRDESKLADRLIVRAMVAIIDNRLTGNSHENLKDTKEGLLDYLEKN